MLMPRRRSTVTRRAGLLALAAVAAVAPVMDAVPARADSVRDDQMWVLNAINAPAAWRVSEGRGVTVAVIDSGVNPDVSDLTGSVITGPDLTGVGTPESDPNWGMHGTWMASLIAGHGHDGGGSGIIGVAPMARVLSIRVITNSGDPGYTRYERQPQARHQHELATAIMYAISHGAGVISMSLGSGGPSLPVRSALQDALNHGIVVLASSGNSGDSTLARNQGHAPYSFPADYPGVLGVAAVAQGGAPANFSSDNPSVKVAAPGVNVPAEGKDGGYWLVSGTSPACALAAGVAALIRSADPALPADLVRQAITSTTSHRPAGGYNDEVGFGTVDAAAALAEAARLSSEHVAGPGSKTGLRKAAAMEPGLSPDSHYGGGPAAIPAAPVAPRGVRQLVVFCLLAAMCLAMIGIATSRLVLMRRPRHAGPLELHAAQGEPHAAQHEHHPGAHEHHAPQHPDPLG
ncbi:MAG TPA: S8 family serine peptidase [Streptosporangiaceae bacterium]|nr:S8 family serine peptidase [Streptosporangiaceae bacterium]